MNSLFCLKVNNLADGDARVVFKNTDLDFRQYKKLKMFVHAEQIPDETLKDYDITAFHENRLRPGRQLL